MGSKRTSSRTVRYQRRWLRVVGWAVLLALAIALIFIAAWLQGRKPPDKIDSFLDAVLATGHTPAVALVIACAGLLHAVWCVRHLILHKLAWNAGPIEVGTFTQDTPLSDASPEQLTVDFRQRLMQLHLQAPTPVPGAAPQGHMLDVLESSSLDPKNPFSWLVGLLRAAVPSHAYEVHGSLRQREHGKRFGVTVQVVSLTGESLAPATLWGYTWDEALARAADEATSAILPQTRRCSAPWGVWRGYAMPGGLLHEYESGARLEHDRRYDEALAAYWRAVELDPMNMVLRLRVGQLQERLGLYLDALATFWGMDVASAPEERRRTRHGEKERREALTSARYRRNVLLGGRVLAMQWCAADGEAGSKLRDEQRARLRRCLEPRIEEALGRGLPDIDTASHEEQFLALRALFAEYALSDCATQRRDLYRGSRLTRATLELTELCINIRLDWVRHSMRSPNKAWSPPDVEDGIRLIQKRHNGAFRQWHEQYNAACAWALTLADHGVRCGAGARSIAEHAVKRLEKATACADSAYIASRRDWVVSEDPDLAALRARHEFKEFALLFLPSEAFAPGRPKNVLQIESSRYVRDLLAAVADRRLKTWREHHAQALVDLDSALVCRWFEDERRIWTRVQAVAVNFRHPKTRVLLIEAIAQCGSPIEVRFPQYERDPLCAGCDGDEKRLKRTAKKAVTDANDRLAQLTVVLEPTLGRLEARVRRLQQRSAAARTVSPQGLQRRCAQQVALWQRLGEWLDADGADALQQARADMLVAANDLAPARNGHVPLSASARRA
jgi:hypothetical protein